MITILPTIGCTAPTPNVAPLNRDAGEDAANP